MASLKDVRKRIQSVKNTQKVTSAMKMVSAAKLRRAQMAIEASRPYALKMLDVMRSLALRTSPEAHPLLAVRPVNKVELVVITSDRGLCGSFNLNVIKKAENFIKQNQGEFDVQLTVVGRKARDYFQRRAYPIRASYVDMMRDLQYADCVKVAQEVMDQYISEAVDEVWLCCNIFQSVIRQTVLMDRLLPIPPLEVDKSELVVEYLYEPSEDVLLNAVLPENVNIQLWRCLLESNAGEHAARMTAMDNATNNAGEMMDKLTLLYNRTRQAAITKELMDIVGGAEALRG